MSLIKANGAGEVSTGFYNGVATQSLRFNDDDSPYLTFDPASATAGTWTASFWVKRGNLASTYVIYSSGVVSARGHIFFTSADQLQVQPFNSSGQAGYTATDRVFRDCSAWYHIVISANSLTTSNIATALVIYVNGEVATRSTNVGSSATGGDRLGDAQAKRIGEYRPDSGSHFDGYLCDFNWVDGTALNQNNFGEFKNGVWIAKDPDVSNYGAAGYRLKFDGTGTSTSSGAVSSPTNIGDDSSGKNNHWGVSGLASTDANLPDCPENNFATLNPLQAVVNDNSTKPTLSEGNLVMSTTTTDYQGFSSTIPIPTEGKYAFKVKMNTESSSQTHRFGVGTSVSGNGISTGTSGGASSWHNALVFAATVPRFDTCKNGTYSAGSTLSPATVAGDEIEFLVDMDNGTIDIKLNGSAYGSQITGMPTDKPLFPFGTVYESSSGASTLTFTFDYTPSDSNYSTICTANLPDPTIGPSSSTQADDHFNTVLWSGNSSTQSITGVGFQPDWVWIKERTSTSSHALYDSSRGVLKQLESDNANDESTASSMLTSFDSDGFSVGSSGAINQSSQTYVGWNWKANGGTTSTNNDGSIQSTVQANTTAGFSIVTYTGNATAGATVGHGLGAVPEWYFVKSRSLSTAWVVYHKDQNASPQNGYMQLDISDDFYDTLTWNDTAPTSSVFSLGGSGYSSNNASATYVAYCFVGVEGYSKFGKYTGNGLTDGTFVYLGFRPAWLMYKRVDSSGNWLIDDNVTQSFNPDSNYLVADTSDQEGDTTTNTAGHVFDMYSNGFKMRNTNSARNADGGTFIYMAFAEAPFKFANAR